MMIVALSAIPAFASAIDLRPDWADRFRVLAQGDRELLLNDTYLYDFGYRARGLEGQFLFEQVKDLGDPSRLREIRQEYEVMSRSFEQKQSAGLSTPDSVKEYQASIARLTERAIKHVQDQSIKRSNDQVIQKFGSNATVKTLVTPAVVAAGIYSGRPIQLRLMADTHLQVQTHVRDQVGRLQLQSPWALGTFEFRPTAQVSSANGSLQASSGVDLTKEVYQVGMARSLPFSDLQTQLHYGASSKTLVSTISKTLTNDLSCALDWVQPMSSLSPIYAREEKVRLKYDLRF